MIAVEWLVDQMFLNELNKYIKEFKKTFKSE